MPQITLVSNATDYDIYERLVAASLGVTTDQSTAAITSVLPRSCKFLNISYPDVAPNNTSATQLLLKDSNANEITRIDVGAGYPETDGAAINGIPLLGRKLRAPVNNALVDIHLEVC